MKRMPVTIWIAGGVSLCLLVVPALSSKHEETRFVHPVIADYGGAVRLPEAAEPLKPNAKVLFDVTANPDTDRVVAGLDRAARLLNVCGTTASLEGNAKPEDVKLVVVLHGAAAKAALSPAAYAKHMNGRSNPNLELISRLRRAGVELFVCGQALAHQGYARNEVTPDVQVAVAAMTVSINRQNAGYAYLPYH